MRATAYAVIARSRSLAPATRCTVGGKANRTSPGSCDQLKSGPDCHGPRLASTPRYSTTRLIGSPSGDCRSDFRISSNGSRNAGTVTAGPRSSRPVVVCCRHHLHRSRKAQPFQRSRAQGCCAQDFSSSPGLQPSALHVLDRPIRRDVHARRPLPHSRPWYCKRPLPILHLTHYDDARWVGSSCLKPFWNPSEPGPSLPSTPSRRERGEVAPTMSSRYIPAEPGSGCPHLEAV